MRNILLTIFAWTVWVAMMVIFVPVILFTWVVLAFCKFDLETASLMLITLLATFGAYSTISDFKPWKMKFE